jgi:hypothetical protein
MGNYAVLDRDIFVHFVYFMVKNSTFSNTGKPTKNPLTMIRQTANMTVDSGLEPKDLVTT